MSDGERSAWTEDPNAMTGHGQTTMEAAKDEAAAVKDTAAAEAKGVVDTTKTEAGSVVREAKLQLEDLYAQTKRELGDQASTQQQRLASGLRSFSGELGSMARNADGNGVASDLVQRASQRADSMASWLSQRDPAAVLQEVKAFARRRPGVFIGVAALTGIVVGRLTRALASAASDSAPTGGSPRAVGSLPAGTGYQSSGLESDAWATGSSGVTAVPAATAGATASTAPTGVQEDAPLYAETVNRWSEDQQEGVDERSDTI
jgi:hypothetical protein